MPWPLICIIAVAFILPAKRADIRLPGIVIPTAAPAPAPIPRKK